MRRLALLLPVALAGCLALAGCSGGSPAGQAAGKSATSSSNTHSTRTGDEKTETESPAAVVDGMHYVQLFNTVDPVLAEMAHDSVGGTLPPGTELQNAAGSLHQFAAQARHIPSAGDDGRRTLSRLAAASSTLAGQLDTLAAKGSESSDSATLAAAVSGFQTAAAAARQAAGLPAPATSSKPQPDTGP